MSSTPHADTPPREHDSAISSELRALGQLQRDLGIRYDTRLDSIQDQIVRLVEQTELAAQQEQASRLAQLVQLRECLASFEAERALRRQQSVFIKSLHFPEIHRRWDHIPRADESTNAWLFDPKKTKFLEWLESGRGIFWITGKVCSPMPPGLAQEVTSDSLLGWQRQVDLDEVRI